MKMIKVLLNNLIQGPSTDPFPFGETFTPEGLRARIHFDETACTGCRMCEHVCAGGAIRCEDSEKGMKFTVWHNSCTFCGLCEHYCMPKAITLTEDWHLAHKQEDKYKMIEQGFVALVSCEYCSKKMIPSGPKITAVAYQGTNKMIEKLGKICPDCRRKLSAKLLSKGTSL
ncbi:4Fe-4S ferredoxin [Photobacterium alginatilyticum]|uniref:4Fe-4S ferredoxin n=1 Tax=Photobacterium alginatilyticum TaxID=1775171 RepID=UPI004068D54F